MKMWRGIAIGAIAVVAQGMIGCASSPPAPKFQEPLKVEHRVRASDTVQLAVTAASGVEMLDSEKQRVSEHIQSKLKPKQALNAEGDARSLKIAVEMTRYEKGNAFARAMLAGLGQIHIDGHVSLYDAATDAKLTEFDVKKTFAWGGIYGAATGIDDLEAAFAEGIAAALTGQKEEETKKKTKETKT